MCTRPITCYENPDGGRPIFGYEGVRRGLPKLKLPCGKCPECAQDYYTSWATRGHYELLQWDSSLFLTLTYNDENLPHDKSLHKEDVQKFIKRVKKYFGSTKENPIRQIYCGEYGKFGRPHYHVILFNADFTDKKKHYISPAGHQVFISDTLSSLWSKGFAELGIATPASIAYLFKYILKKKTRKEKEKPYSLEIDGITYDVEHEFIEASRNPGIGSYMRDSKSIDKGFLSVNGSKKKLPKYYSEALKKRDLATYTEMKDKKYDFAILKKPESELRMRQKENAQKKLTDTKRRM